MSFTLFPSQKERRQLVVGLFLVFSIPFLEPVYSNPVGPTIRHGDIQITGAGGNLQILQSTSHGIIDWNSFSIQNGEVTRFIQPGASAATLNRVTGQSLSRIDGSLLANGRVLLLNPNGVLVGRSGVVDTGGFTASTLDLSNENFLSGGNLRFQGNSTAGVVNLGSINAVDGDVFLIAASVLNEGSISARNGTVGLAAGNDVLIAESGSERVFVRGSGTASEDSGVINRGTVDANVAELKSFGGNIYGMAVRNEGRVAATGVTREGGQIFLRAGGGGRVRSSGTLVAKKPESGGSVVIDSGPGGETEMNGTIDASGESGAGGDVLILGSTINVFEDSLIIADGASGGGRILVGGGRRGQNPEFMNATNVTVAEGASFDASANVDGDGGEIIVFAGNRLNFSGSVAATGGAIGGDGGFIELSGKNEVLIPDLSSRVSLSAANGNSGTLLFDPRDIEILDGDPTEIGEGFPAGLNEIFDGDINLFLQGASLIIETSGEGGEGEEGDIWVRSGVEIDWNGDTDLTFQADRDFIFEGGASIQSRGGGSVEITAARSMAFGVTGVPGEGGITTNTGNITIGANETGTAPGSGSGIAIFSSIETGDGDILITGRAAETFGQGIVLGGSVTASGAGSIRLVGEGSGTGGRGIWLNEPTSLLSSAGTESSITLEANSIDLAAGSIQSPGDLIISPLASNSVINLGAEAADVGLQLTDTELGRLSDGFQSITIGSATLDHVVVNINEVSFSDPVTILTPNVGGEIYVNGQITGTGNASIALNGAGPSGPLGPPSTTYLSAGLSTEGEAITIDDDVVLKAGVLLDTTGSGGIGSPAGGDVTVTGTVIGDEVGVLHAFGINAGSDGSIILGNDVGVDERTVGDVSFTGGDLQLANRLTTGGGLDITVSSNFSLDAPIYAVGDVVIHANQGPALTSGDFPGIEISSSIDSETGGIELVGTGGEIDGGGDGNRGVWLRAGSGLTANGLISITGTTRIADEFGVVFDAPVTSGNGDIRIATGGGDVRVSREVGAFGAVEFSTSSTESVQFLIETDLSEQGDVSFTGGAGVSDTVSFAGSTAGSDEISAAQFENIEVLIGSSSDEDSFNGSGSLASTFSFTGTNAFNYADTGGNTLSVSGFEKVSGGSRDDTFEFMSGGSIELISGKGGDDTVDFSDFGESVFVNVGSSNASGINEFEEIEKFTGSTVGLSNGFFATDDDNEIMITGDGRGSLVTARGFVLGEFGGPFVETIDFTGFQYIDGGFGNDQFVVDMDGSAGTFFDGTLAGAWGDDVFVIKSGSVGEISGAGDLMTRGEPGSDTIDLSASDLFSRFVDFEDTSASGINRFEEIDVFVGGGGGGNSIYGTNLRDLFSITGESSGTIRYSLGEGSEQVASFSGFDYVGGRGGDDDFTIEMELPFTTSEILTGPSVAVPQFAGVLDGGEGGDNFIFRFGNVSTIDGGSSFASVFSVQDTLDFSQVSEDLVVDLENLSALADPSSSTGEHSGPPLIGSIGVEEFAGIDLIIGGAGKNSLLGSGGRDEIYISTGSSGRIVFEDPDPYGGVETASSFASEISGFDPETSTIRIGFENFAMIDSRGGDDLFTVNLSEGDIETDLFGGAGSDVFLVEYYPVFTSESIFDEGGPINPEPGLITSINGGNDEGVDILSFLLFQNDVVVDVGNSIASGMQSFTGIELFEGGEGNNDQFIGTSSDDTFTLSETGVHQMEFANDGPIEFTLSGFESLLGGDGVNELVGTAASDSFLINGDGRGTVSFSTFKPGEGETLEEVIESVAFEGVELVSGDEGDDEFLIQMPSGETFAGTLSGDGGADQFVISPGGSVTEIQGGSERDTIDFSSFTTSVSVNLGTTSATQIGSFGSIESVIGGTASDTLLGTNGNDQFLVDRDNGGFLNSGSFDSFEILRGQAGTDRFVFTEQAVVSGFFGGSGTDTFVLDDSDLGGTNTYLITGNSVSRNPFYLFSEIEFLQFFFGPGNDTVITDDNGLIQILNGGGGNDTIDFGTTPVSGRTPFVFGGTQVFETQFENFLLVRDETNNPDNINTPLPGGPGNQGSGSLIDQFTNAGGFGEALGNAFGAIASNALIAGQASLLQVEGGQVEAPLSLDGFFTKPPQAIVSLLDESLEVDAWAELANAIDFGGATILVRNDGPYSVSLDGVPPNEIIQVLQQLLQMEPASELFEALELTIVLPITAADGAISILAVPVQIEEAVLQQLLGSLDDASFSELTAALDD